VGLLFHGQIHHAETKNKKYKEASTNCFEFYKEANYYTSKILLAIL
jgi:hypothetical protein